ncbi:ornithine cyclodeaminase [Chryseomicrobium aureum]|uniref:ornithine cyclodeaminase family protein n=1 Tax=Chryseomicrobium aureum TaxID=1441723 RepID=UPI00195745BE|nr:ornithine cyclodeaminase family protein [Chryseomicrobium aureum]MBM7705949.1 ornithine cyclodeaminase [Chryseomicrobium aureum]
MRIINDETIQTFYHMSDALRDVETMLVSIHKGESINPHRTVIDVPEKNGSVLYMPSSDGDEIAAVKVVSIFPENPSKALATTQGAILLTELETGKHVGMISGSYLTRLRTGALSALSARHLARPESRILTVIGTGAMAFEQILGIVEVLPIEDIILVNRTTEKAIRFAERLMQFGVSAKIVVESDVRRAVEQADVVCCATRSKEDVFSADMVKPGTHIMGVGSYLPEMREIPVELIPQADAVFVDDLEGVRAEAGELLAAEAFGKWSFDQVTGTLAELIANGYERNKNAITIFKSVGAAHFDLAVAKGVYKKARVLNIGDCIKF